MFSRPGFRKLRRLSSHEEEDVCVMPMTCVSGGWLKEAVLLQPEIYDGVEMTPIKATLLWLNQVAFGSNYAKEGCAYGAPCTPGLARHS